METTYATIEQKFDTTDHSQITPKKKSPLVGILALAAGGVSVAMVPMVNTEGGAGGALFIVLAIGFFVWGLLATFIRKKFYYHVPGSSRILIKEFFFETENFLKVSRIIESDSYIELAKIPQTLDKGIKLRIAYTPNRSLCVVQLLKYVPFEYEVQSEAKELSKEQMGVIFNTFKL
ncbi:MAG: hypothetical protein BGP01_08575 [Paludibacter sp. 47-17]|nr:MAG: hypothetical protein ABS72_00320 [Paludibacter sp. SCN 50-10]ODU60716.1 MAG: hypothetical protein ABT12_00775 [Paludibacter sp. SCN 51-9]OJX88405.1 MAG: hypothetical protein BGP01_08575 [Paludibacter sp. 47-17]